MADNHSKETRSYNMSRIRSRDTKPETIVRQYLFLCGLRYRKNDRRYPGIPDMVFPKYKTIVFVNGCFWHKHNGCRYYVPPKSNTSFWEDKLEKNRLRDKRNIDILSTDGWHVIVVWECELKKPVRQKRLEKLYRQITNTEDVQCISGKFQ